jgi:hypothetical protein
MSKPETVEELLQTLKRGITIVKFLKKDESERVMVATLDPKLLPERDATITQEYAAKNTNQIRVYDVEAEDWRSFLFDRIISVTKAE